MKEQALVPLRSAVVFLTAFMVALAAVALSYMSDRNLPESLLVGGGGFAAALTAANSLISKS